MDPIYELKQKMLFLEQAHASAKMGHFVLDPARRTIEFSGWVRNNIGLNDMPIPLDRLPEIIPEAERDEFAAKVEEIIEHEADFAFETNVVTSKGVVRTQRVSGIPAFENQVDRTGLIGFYGILQEITSDKEARQKLVEARDKAKAELEARANILATVSHEIRTPLGGIMGIIDQLRQERSPAERERALGLMEDSCQALLETLDAILQQARKSGEQPAANMRNFRPNAVAQRVAEMFRPLARRKALQIEVHTSSDSEVKGYPGRVQQVLANFVSNAVKFTQSGVITIYVQPPANSVDQWSFVVSDTGVGMNMKRIERIFERFDTSGKDSLGRSVGSGLGLTITRDIVEDLGGRIEVESEVGKGSSFTVFLPLAAAQGDAPSIGQGHKEGTACVVLKKATEQIQVEATLSQLGWNLVSLEDTLSDMPDDFVGLITVADEESLADAPSKLAEVSERIILVGDQNNVSSDVLGSSNNITTLSSGNLARSLPEVLSGTNDDAA